MRNSQFEVSNAPSYLIHPDNRRVEYGGGFRIIKPRQFEGTQPSTNVFETILSPEGKQQKQIETPPLPQIVYHKQSNRSMNDKNYEYNYNYYHDDRNFSNFFGLEDEKYHICLDHRSDCHICHTCKPELSYQKKGCNICQNEHTFEKKTKYPKNVQRTLSRNKISEHKNQYEEADKAKQAGSLTLKDVNAPKQQDKEISQSKSIYQIVQQPLVPQNPTIQQKIQYERKYKQYLLRKRDLYYLTLLKKLIDKIDFQRYQCTSPNEERIHAHWFGIYKPRVMQSSAGKIKYDIESHPGYEFLKSFIFVYIYQNKYKEKDTYETNAQMFLNAFQQLLFDTEKSDPTKALQKLHAEFYKRILQGRINKINLKQFFVRLYFILMALEISESDLQQKLKRLPNDLSLEQYKKIFTMKIAIKPPQQADINQIIIEKKNSNRSSNEAKIPYKPIFPEIQQLEHSQLINEQPIIASKKLSIREKRLLADLVEKEAKEQEILNYKFKAKDIPKDVRDKSLYEKLLNEQAAKSAKNRQQSAKQLLLNQNPFSFYYRDMHKQSPVEQFKNYQFFKASEVPKHVTEPRYQKMLDEKETLRKQNLEQRQSSLLKSSKFPVTMGYLENYSAFKAKTQQQLPYKFQPEISKEVPNFGHLHQKNIKDLEAKKDLNKTTTSPQEFNLSKAKKRKTEVEPTKRQLPRKRISQSTDRHYMSGSTLKFDALVQHRRKQVEDKEKKMRQSTFEPKTTHHQQVLKQQLQKKIKQAEHQTGGNFVLPPEDWNESKKEEMLHKVYQESPMLLDRRYQRVNGMKVEITK